MGRNLSPMGRNLSPAVRRELENLEKDAESRKMAMKALKSYVKDLDSKAIPLFLAQVSVSKAPSSSCVEHTISLYEVLARVHGPNIVPQIDNIMSTIIKTLTSSAGSFPLQQACSKVVPAIARYGMDPSTPTDKKRDIIHSLCNPLSSSLLGSQESLASGAALCLKALVDSDNWRFASDEVVNEVCLRVASALQEKSTQTNSHMELAMSLAKHNNFTVEAYGRSLIRSGLGILSAGAVEGNSHKRFSAIQMVNFLMKSLDPRSISSDLEFVMEELEKSHSDQMAFVRGAAFEALQTARGLAAGKRLGLEKDQSPVVGSNFRSDYNRKKNLWNARGRSPVSASPESQTVDSFAQYDSSPESPISTGQVACNFNYDQRSVNRKLWTNENGGVNVSLKDGLYSNGYSDSNGSRVYIEHLDNSEVSNDEGDHSAEFSGFVPKVPTNGAERSFTPSPERTRSQLNIDDIKIFTTPRKLIHSLQDLSDENSDCIERRGRRFRSPVSSKYERSPITNLERNGQSQFQNSGVNEDKGSSEVEEQGSNDSESVASTNDVAIDADQEVSCQLDHQEKSGIQRSNIDKKRSLKTLLTFNFGLIFVLLAVFLPVLWSNSHEEGFDLPPT